MIVDAPSSHPNITMLSVAQGQLCRATLKAAIPVCMLLAPRGTIAQARRCDRVGTSEFTFGQTGGNIIPRGLRVGVDGIVTRASDSVSGSPAVTTVSPDAVRGVARLAWTNGFAALPVSPTRPTRNPDAARDFIELRSACGNKHVEYATGEGAPAFRELFALLTALTAAAPSTRR